MKWELKIGGWQFEVISIFEFTSKKKILNIRPNNKKENLITDGSNGMKYTFRPILIPTKYAQKPKNRPSELSRFGDVWTLSTDTVIRYIPSKKYLAELVGFFLYKKFRCPFHRSVLAKQLLIITTIIIIIISLGFFYKSQTK